MQEEVQLVARAIRLPLGRALDHGLESELEHLLRSVFRIDRVYGVYVYDPSGTIVASAGATDPLPSPDHLTELASGKSRIGEYGEVGGREVYSYFIPLTSGDGSGVGLLQVTRRRSEIESYLRRLRLQTVLLLSLGALVMIALVIYGHEGAIGRHLGRLSRSMAQVEGGDHEHRAEPAGPRELAALATGLNTMLDSLAEASAEIAEQKETQIELESRLWHAEKLAAIGRLATGVAHELGTPLSVIDGKAQRLLRELESGSPAAIGFETIRAEVRRLEEIVRQLLDFGRRSQIRRKPVLAEVLASSAIAAVEEEAEAQGTKLSIEGPIPSPTLTVDPIQIEQVLTNLLRNAIQATDAGRVELSWFEDGNELGFIVDDDGPGIPPASRQRIFEPFYTTKPVGAGTGLGLSVAHGIVEEHGGRLEVCASPLGGARFTLRVREQDPGYGH